jgi:hydroxymethylpyrimidine pyrophosphatase-like HAD family hydrolase
VLTVIVIITARSKCTAKSYCDNNDNNGKFVCSIYSYCDNNWEVYLQCYQLL